jgi:DNA anti-recombination protein RmuC
MYAYLTTVLFGLRCLRIEANAAAILDFCGRLQQDLERFQFEYDTLGRHLGNARSKYEEGERRLGRFRDKLERVSDLGESGREQAPVGAGAGTWSGRPGDGESPVGAPGDEEEAPERAAGA